MLLINKHVLTLVLADVKTLQLWVTTLGKGNTSKNSKNSKNPKARSYKATTDQTEDSDDDSAWEDFEEDEENIRKISWPLLISDRGDLTHTIAFDILSLHTFDIRPTR